MKVTLTVEIDWKEYSLSDEKNIINSPEESIITAFKVVPYFLAWKYSRENGRTQKDWVDKITPNFKKSDIAILSPEDAEIIKSILWDKINTFYGQKEDLLDWEIGRIDTRLIVKK